MISLPLFQVAYHFTYFVLVLELKTSTKQRHLKKVKVCGKLLECTFPFPRNLLQVHPQTNHSFGINFFFYPPLLHMAIVSEPLRVHFWKQLFQFKLWVCNALHNFIKLAQSCLSLQYQWFKCKYKEAHPKTGSFFGSAFPNSLLKKKGRSALKILDKKTKGSEPRFSIEIRTLQNSLRVLSFLLYIFLGRPDPIERCFSFCLSTFSLSRNAC